MVKAKKGKKEIVASGTAAKNSSGDEMDNDNKPQTTFIDTDDVDEVSVKNKKNQSKNKKNLKKQVSSIDSDNEDVSSITSGTKAANAKGKKGKLGKKNKSVDADDEEEGNNERKTDVEDDNSSKKEKKNKKKSEKKFGFDLLIADGDDDGDVNKMEQQQGIADPEDDYENIKSTKKNDKSGKKGKKAKRKGKDDDDEEDLDKILAELQAEYTGEEPANVVAAADDISNDKDKVNKKKKTKKADKLKPKINLVCDDPLKGDIDVLLEEDLAIDDGDYSGEEDGGGTIKTAAQKKKEKKERQKREAALAKQKVVTEGKPKLETIAKPIEDVAAPAPEVKELPPVEAQSSTAADVDDKPSKKDKKKGKKEKKTDEEDSKKDSKKKGISAAMVTAMQERLKKIKEEEERQQKEEEERIRQDDERERLRLEAIRIETERKEKKKQKEAERKARLKAEGKLLTKKQKEDRARAQAMLDALKAQGLEIPDPAEKRARPGTRMRLNKKKGIGGSTSKDDNITDGVGDDSTTPPTDQKSEEIKVEAIKESWDASDSEQEEGDEVSQATTTNNDEKSNADDKHEDSESDEENSEDEDDEDAEDDDNTDEESEKNSEDDGKHENRSDAEIKRERAIARIEKRQEEAEKKRTTDDLRAAVVCVLGHVDTGKTKILDKLRRTNVQDCEAGGITQQIGATNVPIDAIKEQSKFVKNALEFVHRLPGLLIIDTPGHESFSNLRNRGSSLCDIAILVVDIMHGLEPQTLESINLLKKKKCPFIVALNKIDRLYDWKVTARRDIRDVIKEQQSNTQLEFNQRCKEVVLQFAEQGLNAALFYENPDPKTYVSLVPTSAITGEGMGNLLFLIVEFCQKMLAKRLMYSEELQATVLEVKAIPGLGTTIDAILINGRLHEGDTIIIAGTDGPITTQIRSLLMPQPMKELRVKNAYVEYKEIKAAQGVKIAAKDLEKAIAGINLLVAHKPDEIELCRDEVARELKNALSHIKLATTGVYVQASTLGSLEALLEFLRQSKIPYSAIRIGPVVKRDVMKASIMLEHEAQYATILAFDVKIERDAQEMADSVGVKIFQADIIYHLFDKFTAYREELKQKKRDEFRSVAVFPCKLKILPQFIFNSRDPIVMGVMVENGIVKVGTPLCVPSKEFVDIGIVTSIESNHKNIESARKGQEICIKIDPIPGESPKMFGRHFEADDMLVSKISRQSIDACKDYFRDDLIKADWSLMVELKKLFQIL